MSMDLICRQCQKSLQEEDFYHRAHRLCSQCHGDNIRIGYKFKMRELYSLNSCGSLIYIIQSDIGGPVKIGKSSGNGLIERLMSLQAGNPNLLRIVALAHNQPPAYEKEMHLRFQAFSIRLEWFAARQEIADYIASEPRWTIYDPILIQQSEENPPASIAADSHTSGGEMLDIESAAQYLGLTSDGLYYYTTRKRVLRGQMIGSSMVFTRAQLDEFNEKVLATRTEKRGRPRRRPSGE